MVINNNLKNVQCKKIKKVIDNEITYLILMLLQNKVNHFAHHIIAKYSKSLNGLKVRKQYKQLKISSDHSG